MTEAFAKNTESSGAPAPTSEALAPTIVATSALTTTPPAVSEPSNPDRYKLAPGETTERMLARLTPEEKALKFESLMKLPAQVRKAHLESIGEEKSNEFLWSIPDMQRAVLLSNIHDITSPSGEDCSSKQKAIRHGIMYAPKPEGTGVSTAKEIAGNLVFGMLGIGEQANAAKEVIGTGLFGISAIKYVDVCDMSPGEKAALLNPPATPKAGANSNAAVTPSNPVDMAKKALGNWFK